MVENSAENGNSSPEMDLNELVHLEEAELKAKTEAKPISAKQQKINDLIAKGFKSDEMEVFRHAVEALVISQGYKPVAATRLAAQTIDTIYFTIRSFWEGETDIGVSLSIRDFMTPEAFELAKQSKQWLEESRIISNQIDSDKSLGTASNPDSLDGT